MTPDQRKALRRKALWRVSDLASYMGVSHKVALSLLQRYNAALGNLLLRPSRGKCRVYTFLWRPLARHAPDVFLDDALDTQERIDRIENRALDVFNDLRTTKFQTGQNSRAIAKLQAVVRRVA